MGKISKSQAKALARVLFGGTSRFLGNLSDEPNARCYVFARGVFQLCIYEKSNHANIFVGETLVGRIYLDDPLDLTVEKLGEVKI